MKRQLKTFKLKEWVVLGRTIFKPPFRISDTLINEARIVHVRKGQSNLYAANQYTKLKDGDTLIMKSDNFVNSWLANDSEEYNDIIVFQLTADMLKHIYHNQLPSWFSDNVDNRVSPIQKLDAHFLLSDYFKNLCYYLENAHLISEELLQLKIQELLHILVKVDLSGSNKKILGSLFQANEYKFQEVIQAHLFDDLNLEELAFLTGLSLSSFKRKFSGIYGTSPNKYFVSKRLEKAQILLRTTDKRISEVAYDCGYSNAEYFARVFQKYHNCTPSKYREKLLS